MSGGIRKGLRGCGLHGDDNLYCVYIFIGIELFHKLPRLNNESKRGLIVPPLVNGVESGLSHYIVSVCIYIYIFLSCQVY